MKNLFLLILLLMPLMAFSQFKEVPEPNETDEGISVQVLKDTPNAELTAKFVNQNYCLQRFRRSRATGRWFGFMGLSFTTASIAGGEEMLFLSGIGGLFGIIGTIIHMSADRWLKKASIEPTRRGTSFVFEF